MLVARRALNCEAFERWGGCSTTGVGDRQQGLQKWFLSTVENWITSYLPNCLHCIMLLRASESVFFAVLAAGRVL